MITHYKASAYSITGFKICMLLYLLLASFNFYAQPSLQYTTEDGLPTHHIYDVLEGPEGFIWLATNRGLVKFDGNDFTVFTHKNGLPNNDVWKLRIDAKRRLWFFSKSNRQGYVKDDSIHTFKITDNKVISPNKVYAYPDKIAMVNYILENNEFVPNTEIDIHNLLYNKKHVKRRHDSIVLLDEHQHIIKAISMRDLDLDSKWRMDYYPHQQYIVRGLGWTLFGDAKTNDWRLYDHNHMGISNNKMVMVKFINHQFQMSSGEHLIIVNKKFEVVQRYKLDKAINNNFALKDSKGNIWLWGQNIGLKLMTNIHLNTDYYLMGEKVNVIGQMAGKVVSASESSGFRYFDWKNNSFYDHPFISSLTDVTYHNIEYPTAEYLISNNFGIEYTQDNGYRKIYSPSTVGVGGKDLLMYNGIDYWITSSYLVSKNQNLFIRQKGLNDVEEWNGDIVLSSAEGLKVLKNDSIVSFLPKESNLNFPTTRLAKGERYLWVGTDGKGIYGYRDNEIKQIKSTEDLNVREIIENGDTLWIASNRGIKKILIHEDITQSKIIDNYYKNDGLLQNNTNDIYLSKDSLWVATDEGISILDFGNTNFNTPTKLYFKNLEDTLTIGKRGSRNLNISFGAQNYGNQENLQFAYRLLPSEEWVKTEARSISFNDLKPDKYTLEVRAIDQHYQESYLSLPISVMPLWWESDWAVGLFILLGLGLLYLIIYLIYFFFQRRRYRKLNQEKRMQSLQLQALRSQMNPHFVHNSLNAIQYFIQMNDVEKSEEYLSKFSDLIRLFFEFSRENQITLKQEIKLLTRYIEIEKLRFEDRLNYKIIIDPELYIEEQEIPTMILQPLVENAINHGLFHKKENGNLTLQFERFLEDGFKVVIKDDGIGIPKAKEIFDTSVKNYKSNSSMVLDERLKLLNLSGEWSIDYNIESTSTGENTGTTITIIFKN